MAMAAGAGAALLRSVATKMARAPPRLPSALDHHGRLPTSSGDLWLSRFSTSTGSTPSSANLRDPQTYNKKIPSGNEWDWFIAGVKDAAPKAAYGLVFSGSIFIYFYVIPALDRINAQMDALCDKLNAFNKEMEQQQNERGHAALDSMGSQIEARDEVGEFSKGQRIQASGQVKEHL
ncbi:uncharacterized protein [Miscanthus floridulus]|uniref:uncharacterized protein n=1 Tax=Miscanthus floridulus TaxID=154761 RepID=UPI003458EB2C